ncbi:hypothetical protein F4809DRAFT_658494 [Biscogniauxia mediterranea]|nr:hypothetical protein F4809DRAFT_658494 [Biscogniauxia mediterranea]
MFGLTSVLPSAIGPPPKNVPPPTPIKLPRCTPQVPDSPSEDGPSEPSLVRFLQTLHRPADISDAHFAALGVHVHPDVPAEGVVPDPSYLPSATGWDGIDLDEARRRDSAGFRRPLCNGNTSPEARVFLERRNELSIPNQAAFRTVRRIKPTPGKQPPRLGNCYEFFKQLDQVATFWDDTSMPPWTGSGDDENDKGGEDTTTAAAQKNGDTTTSSPAQPPAAAAAETPDVPERVTYRTGTGASMPAEFRHNLVSAFIRLVAYDFGCNLAPPRLEPRLHLLEPPPPSPQKSKSKSNPASSPPPHPPHPPPPPTLAPAQKASYFPSGCVFICRIPGTRDAARQGFMDGPVAAVSARNTTGFFASPAFAGTGKAEDAARLDLGRELVAALITAQHRARAGRDERRFGEGKWWATQRRWGGGPGGPIGREVEGGDDAAAGALLGDKDAPSSSEPDADGPGLLRASAKVGNTGGGTGNSNSRPTPAASLIALRGGARGMGIGGIAGGLGGAGAKKSSRKGGPTVYDSYRKVRPPSSNWDRKVRYEAIGRARGADHDDVFVVSSLFHHVCVLRVRVPDRLLEVLDGGAEEDGEDEGEGEEGEEGRQGKEGNEGKGKGKGKRRSWDKLEVWRSRWFDLFLVEERLEAMRLVWGMMAWVMRKNDGEGEGVGVGGGQEGKEKNGKNGKGKGKGDDVDMTGT